MKRINPFQMNDWAIGKFLKVILSIQLAMLCAIGLDAIGLQIPILRQLIGFIYLTFIPGILILRILKLHKLGNVEMVLYTVGLSIATLMFTGLFMNTVYPIFGISGPISTTPLIITISVVVFGLCVLSYVRDKDFSNPSFIDVKSLLLPPALFLCLIPFLAVFGTYLMNFYHINVLLMFLIVILAIIVVLIAFDKFIPKNLYPLAVFVIAISLLYHSSLISMHLWGWDIQIEHYFSNLVILNSIWDPTIAYRMNAMLTIVMLAPAYSIICGMSLTWVFKVIYPLLFSLVPLGLYRVFQKQTDDRIAFLSCFLFVSLGVFFCDMLQLARQQIAELFIVLLILSMIDKNMNRIKRSFLFIVFGISLAVSHYGSSYLYMFLLIAAWLILFLMDHPAIQELRGKFRSKLSRYKNKEITNKPISSNMGDRTISSTFVLLFVIFTLTWYMYVSSSSAFDTIVHAGDHIANSIYTDFLNPESSEALNLIVSETISPLHEVNKILHHVTQFFIVVGILDLLFIQKHPNRFDDEYSIFSLVYFVGLFAIIAVPYSGFDTRRLYHLSYIFLAPFCIIGGIATFRMLTKLARASWTSQSVGSSLKILSVFFAIFLLFNTGFIFEVANDVPTSISLNSTKAYPRFNEQEVLGVKWLHHVKGGNPISIYADAYRSLLLSSFSFERGRVRSFPVDIDKIKEDSYVYLGNFNIINGSALITHGGRPIRSSFYINSSTIVNNRNKIYANGGAQVYYR